eukprot:767959-Hanusia_phi.AAC.2
MEWEKRDWKGDWDGEGGTGIGTRQEGRNEPQLHSQAVGYFEVSSENLMRPSDYLILLSAPTSPPSSLPSLTSPSLSSSFSCSLTFWQ